MQLKSLIEARRLAKLVLCLLVLDASSTYAATNLPPTISGTPSTWVALKTQYSFRPTATDPERKALTFTVANKPAWASFDASTGRLYGTPTAVGLWTGVTIKVSDGVNTASLAFSIRAVSTSNVGPTLSGTPPTSATIGTTYSFKPTANDPNGDPLVYKIANKPSWASFDIWSGTLSGTPSTAASYANITISASDGSQTATLPAFTITVKANSAPKISGTPATAVIVKQAYSFQPTASDANGDTLGFSVQNKPSWATFSTTTGKLAGTPTATGTFSNIIISASDGKLTSALAAFTVTVKPAPNSAPVISGTPLKSVNSGSAYSFRPSASDANGDTLTFAIANRPAWAAFNTATGQLSGTPSSSQAGTYSNIVISVSDGKASVALPAFAIQVIGDMPGTASLTWTAPTQNVDGSALTDLAGYRISYGASPGALAQTIQIANPGLTAYVIEDLPAGTYYFAVRAYTSGGAESANSNLASKAVR
jgi:hypothetical protein